MKTLARLVSMLGAAAVLGDLAARFAFWVVS